MQPTKLEFDITRSIHFDWKTPGHEFMPLFQHEYPDVVCLHENAFEKLVDELTTESPELCLEPIAAYLAPFNFQLWHIDYGDDSYVLSLVPKSKASAFKKYWKEQAEEADDFTITVQQIETAIKKPKEKIKKNPKKRRILTEDIFEHHDFGGILGLEYDCSLSFVRFYNEDDEIVRLVDFSVWPPKILDLPDQNKKKDKEFYQSWRPFFQSSKQDLWKHETKYEKKTNIEYFQFAQVSAISPWSAQIYGDKSVSLRSIYEKTAVMDKCLLHVSRIYNEKLKSYTYELNEVSPTIHRVLYRSSKSLALYPLSDGKKCIVIEGQERFALFQGSLHVTDFKVLPVPLYQENDCFFVVQDLELVYFSEYQIPNSESPAYQERRLQLNRVSLQDGSHKKSQLDGFWSEQKLNTQFLKSQPKTYINFRSFDGAVNVAKGSGDWWIFNHLTNSFGKTDLAWLWNSETNEVLKIHQSDFPRQSPTILFLKSLGRYLGNDSRFLSLLGDLPKLLSEKDRHWLTWS